MTTIRAAVLLLSMLLGGYFILKEALHIDTPKEKMLKILSKPNPKRYPKALAILLGVFCFFGALYLAAKLLLDL